MRDITSVSRIQLLHPAVRVRFQKFIETCEDTLDITLRIVQGLRTFDEQAAIYAQGRTTPGKIVSNAKAGSSYHNYGLAIDIAQLDRGQVNWKFDYGKLQKIARDMDIVWGADWDNDGKTKAQGDKDEHLVDMPHFQISFGYTWQTLLTIYNAHGFLPGTKYLRLPNAV